MKNNLFCIFAVVVCLFGTYMVEDTKVDDIEEPKIAWVSGMDDVSRSGLGMPDGYFDSCITEKEEQERLEQEAAELEAIQAQQIVYYEPVVETAPVEQIDISQSTSSIGIDGQSFRSQGVVYENGTRYTYYSSNVAYHYRTSEWTPNENGMYTTSDGYLVVASSDYPQGTIIDTPWGQAQVLDTGCSSGTVDMYVNY